MVSNDVYLLPLNDDGSPQVTGEYIYLAPETRESVTIRFAIEGTSSICRHGSLWVNIPERGAEFRRDKFREFKLVPDFNRTLEISIPIYEAGAYAFYTTYAELPDLANNLAQANGVSTTKTKKTPLYYIDVAPRLTLDGQPLPLPALSVFSIISKFMGRYPQDWERHLRGISDRGYNMIHFTPLQVRGASDSPYSLYDQLGWDPNCFPEGEKDVQKLVESLEKNHSMLSLTDIVLNHTAHNSTWLLDHPEAGYNLTTAPWLESAYLLDSKLLELSYKLEKLGLPTDLKSVDDLVKIMDAIKKEVMAEIRLWEYYALDVDRDADAAIESWVVGKTAFPEGSIGPGGIDALRAAAPKDQADFLVKNALKGMDRLGERFRRRVDPNIAAALLSAIFGRYEGESGDSTDQAAARVKILEILDIVNVPFYKEYDAEVAEILQQLFNRIKYVRLDEHGPKQGPINAKNPLIETYFTRLPLNEKTVKHRKEDLALVNNGWVWGGNALVDNAGPQSRVYLRREVIVWGDCTKLRYGAGPNDSPWLWEHMTKYARMLAKYFAGFRIDNCHSTPLHVAEHILDEARRVRPDLFVVAELFTGSEEMDYVFVKRLGLSSLVREAMQAWSTAELSRLVHRHGGRPIGSFEVDEISSLDVRGPVKENGETVNGEHQYTREIIRRIKPVPVQALFMDCTHDNEVPAQKRDARDTLPNAALVCMCSSATGSVMGYDEIYPKLVDLVSESRLYTSESSKFPVKVGDGKGGIGGVKKLLNQIHTLMGLDGYDETHIHHEDQYITVHRVHPGSRKGYFLIAHTAFPGYGNGNGAFNAVHLTGTKAKHLGSWMLEVDSSKEAVEEVLSDKKYLRGLPSRLIALPGIRMEVKGDDTIITVRDRFPPGSIALFETWIPAAEHSSGLDTFVTSGAKVAMDELSLIDLNFLLYKCEPEEHDVSNGRDGTYDIPGHGKIVYAGLQGWWSILADIIKDNNLAHPLCQHLRDGQWALDYIVGRLERASKLEAYSRLAKPAAWLRERFDAIRGIPSFLLPRYFGLVLRTAYMAAFEQGVSLMNHNIRNGQWFLQKLAMVSTQQTGLVKSASLYPNRLVPSLAAGLPHFAVDWARCWGRDVFISLRGLYLGTGRFDEAKEHIRAFAGVLKHGMIPNLLGSGNTPRYNARDSVWFFLQCIQDYTRIAPDGLSLLDEKIKRRFLPYDDTWFPTDDPRAYSKESTIGDIVLEVLQRHAAGMKFREANAGPGLDMQMGDEGFNIEIRVDWSNGFIFGGNQKNCGTWMDKMGESDRAGSKGVPGTPRDGAAVEITGLLYSSLRWVASLNKSGKYSYASVRKTDGSEVTFEGWASLIKSNFERCYFVPISPSEDSAYDINTSVVHRRGIYKDLYRSGKEYEDYQLRPNFPIAMTSAPDLFDDKHAMHALCIADSVLRGPTGMATLDPGDMNYRPYYHNSEDSTDFATSKGRNYHQGPEWLWPTGFFLRALLKFDLKRRGRDDAEGRTEAFQQVTRRLIGCKEMIERSPWAGLAELTQKNGEHCADSSPTQAWSASCLIDLYMDAADEQAKLDSQTLPLR
ncbi:glucanotransferase domain of glycogen debranching enzyme-domain-containing protein [Lasiosphaeria miniovina]|uniref:Glycogen debranching enzyme n=1 Tax=Lasiosphaeria miniovina TaxID=1954250 RepID=A0AA40EEG6_9PEZI|nr:glucanotransferase domain of glycogen debranching enzyme-domain-containing protein [Lasiosphaeria miniovina]KAK0734496.1 glucanotransferase domain of glycogen debranching enzyme-domain-containing protein [Lasiosphaeria miniovina]